MTVAGGLARLVIASALVVQAVVAPAAAQGECSDPGAVRALTSDWIKVAPPRFALDPQSLTDIAADPLDPDHFFVTNGKQVMETKDAGCSWGTVYENPAALAIMVQIPASGEPGRIVLAESEASGVTIHLSDDWGKTWSESSDSVQELFGFQTCPNVSTGSRGPLQIAASNPKIMYLCVTHRATTFNEPYVAFYVSNDAGTTWAPTVDPVGTATGYAANYRGPFTQGNTQIYVDPWDAKSVWAVVNDLKTLSLGATAGVVPAWHTRLLYSKDGAATWSTVRRVDPGYYNYTDLSFTRRATGPRSVFVAVGARIQPECPAEDSGCILTSDDQGASWRLLPAEFGMSPSYMEAGRGDRHFVVAAGGQGTYVYRVDMRRGTWTNISSPDPEQFPAGIDAAVGPNRSAYFIFGRTGIDRFTGKV